NGKIYAFARSTNHIKSVMAKERWDLVEGGEFNYHAPNGLETMCVYEKNISKNKEFLLPVVTDFSGVTLLCSDIEYKKPPFIVSNTDIEVKAYNYMKVKFDDGGKIWTNRDYSLVGVPDEFRNFDLLIRPAIPRGKKSPNITLRSS